MDPENASGKLRDRQDDPRSKRFADKDPGGIPSSDRTCMTLLSKGKKNAIEIDYTKLNLYYDTEYKMASS